MSTATVAMAGERPVSPRARGFAVGRGRAFFMHLGLSIMIASIAGVVIFSLRYPHPYFQAMGAWHVLRVLIGVDVVLGPLLTLVVFKPGKRGLKFDLTIIAIR